MSYYAILTPAYTGHLHPMTALGRTLQRRGHRVVLLSPLDGEVPIRKAGIDYLPIAASEFPVGEWNRVAAEMGRLSGLAGTRCATTCLGRLARGILRELPALSARERFDGLVMDQIAVGTEGACEVARLPLAVACNAIMLHAEPSIPPQVFTWPYRRTPLAWVRNLAGFVVHNSAGWPVLRELLPFRFRHKLSFIGPSFMTEHPPSLVQLSQLPEFLDFPRRRLPDHFYYTGPWIDHDAREEIDFPWNRLDGRPLIYASLGTLQNRLAHVFDLIIEACAGLDVQMVLSLGRKDAEVTPVSGGHIVVNYAPQCALLKRAALVITHAGLNTTLEALTEGVPLVALPITNDQPGVAARIRYAGVGEFVPIAKLNAGALRRVIETVLRNPDYRKRAQECADRLRRTDGLVQAADLIERAFTTRQRVRRM